MTNNTNNKLLTLAHSFRTAQYEGRSAQFFEALSTDTSCDPDIFEGYLMGAVQTCLTYGDHMLCSSLLETYTGYASGEFQEKIKRRLNYAASHDRFEFAAAFRDFLRRHLPPAPSNGLDCKL